MMDLIDKLRELAAQIPKQMAHIEDNEEATKNALVMPFINALGYNVFDPTEVRPEATADIPGKKGEKVDYAILKDQKPILIFECKSAGTNLKDVHAAQLFRYYSVEDVRFGILTNGIVYNFYSDLEIPNRMDEKPFLIFDLLNFDERLVNELKKFTKSTFDVDDILATAKDLKYRREIKQIMAEQFANPCDEFVRFFAKRVHAGPLRQTVIDEFEGITKAALRSFVREQIENSLRLTLDKEVLTSTDEIPEINETEEISSETETIEQDERQIVTTQEELEGYFIVKSILRETVDAKRITIRDTMSYCGILLDDTNRKPICRLHFERSQKYLGLLDENKNEERIPIENVDDIFQYADKLKARVALYDQV